MDTLTIEGVKDYQLCSLLYKYRHIDELHESIPKRDLLSIRYDNVIKKIAAFFFYKKQSGSLPSTNAILNRWERLWFPKNTKAEDLISEQHESAHGNLVTYNSTATNALIRFYEDFANDKRHPVLINEDFVSPLSKKVKLNGTFDLMLQDVDKNNGYKFHYIKWVTSKRPPSHASLILDFGALKSVLDYRYNKVRKYDISYYIYDLGSSSPGITKMNIEKNDESVFRFWANEAVIADKYPPRRGLTTYCKRCPFDKPCSKFSID